MEAKPNKRDYKPRQFPVVTQKKLDAILKDIAEGSTKKHASEANGVSARQFHYLIAQGIVDLEFSKPHTMCANLVRSLRAIEQEEIKWCREQARESEDGHKGAQWTLEHAYWRYFGKDANAKELAEEIERLRDEMKGVKDGDTNERKTQEDTEE
jgi:phage terminase Nu1 subunit (DNA packaging protein)